jgi:hypothetical protein
MKEERRKKKEERKKERKRKEILRINIFPFHHQQGQCLVGYLGCFRGVSLLCPISGRGHQHVSVGGLMYHGGIICKILPSIINKIS